MRDPRKLAPALAPPMMEFKFLSSVDCPAGLLGDAAGGGNTIGEPAPAADAPLCVIVTPLVCATNPANVDCVEKSAVGALASVARKVPQGELVEPAVQVSFEGGNPTVVLTIMLPAVTVLITTATPATPVAWVRALM